MEITVVGSGTVVPRRSRRQSCVMVEGSGETVVVDLGSGAVRGMLHAGLNPFAIDRIFFTHFHPDHTTDAVPLIFSMNYGADEPRTRPLYVTGPEPFREFWGHIMGAWGEWMSGDYPLEVSELVPDSSSGLYLTVGNLRWAPAEHRPESIAYRFDSSETGNAFVYTGDTQYAETVVDLARGAHTLLTECSFPDEGPVPGHLTPESAARMARESSVERLVLTHIFPPAEEVDLVAEVGRFYGGEVLVAHDGLKFSV